MRIKFIKNRIKKVIEKIDKEQDPMKLMHLTNTLQQLRIRLDELENS